MPGALKLESTQFKISELFDLGHKLAVEKEKLSQGSGSETKVFFGYRFGGFTILWSRISTNKNINELFL